MWVDLTPTPLANRARHFETVGAALKGGLRAPMPLGWYYKMKTFLKPYQAEVYIPQMVQVYFPGTIPGVPVFFPDFFPGPTANSHLRF